MSKGYATTPRQELPGAAGEGKCEVCRTRKALPGSTKCGRCAVTLGET